MKYSVLMSLYYKVDVKFIFESISSVINQTLKPDEIVIVKDGKLTQKQEDLLKKFDKENKGLFKFITFEKNMGQGYAYEYALSKCKNDLVTLMDSDDICDLTKNEIEVKYLTEHKDIDMVGSDTYEFTNDVSNIISYRKMPVTHEEIVKFSKKRCPLVQPTTMFRKDKVLAAGGYKEGRIAEDWDLYIRMIQNGLKLNNIDKPLVYVRVNDDFYSRRGGIKYLKTILEFKKKHYKSGFFSFKDYAISSCAHIITCLMPNFIRTFIYKKFLRKRV